MSHIDQPRTGGGEFSFKSNRAPDLTLDTAPLPMADAPTDGTVIEVLFDGDWYPVHWSDSALDMSPTGCPGWAHEPDRLLMVDLEGWRELPDGEARAVDEAGDRARDAEEQEQARLAVEAADLREQAAQAREQARARRAALEARYEAFTGEPPHMMRFAELRSEVQRLDAAHTAKVIGELFGSLNK